MVDYIKAGGETPVNTTATGNQVAPVIATLAGGRYVVAWTDAIGTTPIDQTTGTFASHAQIYNADSTRSGIEIEIDALSSTYERVRSITPLTGGGFAVAWQSYAEVGAALVRTFDANGAAIGGAVSVAGPSGGAYDPSVAGLAGGGFAMVFAATDGEGQGVALQLFDVNGAKIGGATLVNTQQASYQGAAVVTGLGGGGFVVTWEDTNFAADGNQTATRAQVYNAAGVPLGKEIGVNTAAQGSQIPIDIFALADGGFGVEYKSIIQGGLHSALVQLFDATGAKTGGEHDLVSAGGSIVALADGSYIVTTANDSFSGDTYYQRYDADFAKVGTLQTVNTDLTGRQNLPDVALAGNGFVIAYQTDQAGVDGDGGAVLMQRFALPGSVGTRGNDILAAPSDAAWTANGGAGNDDMTGGAGDDRISGGAGNDVLRGGGGDDRLAGGDGNDTLVGGSGRDVLNGGAGDDRLVGGIGQEVMTGGAGADTFAFTAADLGNMQDAIDARIADFTRGDGDRIDVSAIDAVKGGANDAFTFIGDGTFSGTAGELRIAVIGGITYAFGDTDGDTVANLVIRIDGTPDLTASDFLL